MRRIRTRFVGFIILILMISMTSVTVLGETDDKEYEYYTYAVKLSEIGVFVGTGNGFELHRSPNRIEGLIILIRLLGKEQEALAGGHETSPFVDVPAWASHYVNYAYATGLTNGISTTEFGASNPLEPKSFLTFVLRSLGYDDSKGDFNWSTAVAFAGNKQVIDNQMVTQLVTEDFLRNHVAKISYDALNARMHNMESEKSLAQYLVEGKAIDHDVAVSIGVLDSDLALNVDNIDSLTGESQTQEETASDNPYVDENGETPLLGQATATRDTVERWAIKKGMKQEGLELIDLYYELSEKKGLNPVIQYVQMCLETGYLYKIKSQSGLDASYHNPCGLKITEGGANYQSSTFMKFDTWYNGIDAHTDHSALYAGVVGYPRADTMDPRHFSWLFGRVTTVEGLSGTWAESDYHTKILKLYQEILDMNP